jgi:hypothetical protein
MESGFPNLYRENNVCQESCFTAAVIV